MFPVFLAHAQPAILRIWYEAHEAKYLSILQAFRDLFMYVNAILPVWKIDFGEMAFLRTIGILSIDKMAPLY